MSTAGKKKVTREQVDAVLKELAAERRASPLQGQTAKQFQANAKQRAARTAKARVQQEKAANPTIPKTSKKKAADKELAKIAQSKGKKGHTYEDLSPDQGKGQQAMRSTVRADAESAALGEPRKKEESALMKTLNFIGRPMFASAEAVQDNQEKYYRARHKGDNKAEAVWKGFKAGFGGWNEGISGKKKTTFSKVIQEVANNQKANRVGIGAARDNEIEPAKVNPVLKHGLGLTLDIFADPLTYTGVGLITKVAAANKIVKGKEVAQGLVDTVAAQKRIIDSGADIGKAQLDEILAVNRAPVEQIKRLDRKSKKLLDANPEAKALYEQVRLQNKKLPTRKRKGAAETAHYGRQTPVRAFAGKLDIDEIDDPIMKERISGRWAKEIEDNPGILNTIHSAHVKRLPRWNKAYGEAWRRDMGVHGGRVYVHKGITNKQHREYMEKVVKEGLDRPGWFSVVAKTPEEFAEATFTHEVGHQVAWNMPDQVKREFLDDAIKLIESKGQDPVEFFKQHLSQYSVSQMDNADNAMDFLKGNAEEVFAESWAEFRMLGGKARPIAKRIGTLMEGYVKQMPVAPTRSAITAIDEVADNALRSYRANAMDALLASGKGGYDNVSEIPSSVIDDMLKKDGITRESLVADLTGAMQRNLSPQVQKQLRVRFGTKNVAIPGTENFGKMMSKAQQVSMVNKTTKVFNDTFRAMAKVNPTLGLLRNQGLAQSTNRVAALLTTHQRAWDNVTPADRKAILKDWRASTPNGSTVPGGVDMSGNPIDNALDHFDTQMVALQDTVNSLRLTPNEIGAWLQSDPKFGLNVVTAPGWKVGPTGKQTRLKGPDTDEWLIQFIKNNEKLEDPGRVLFQLHAAIEHTIAKRSVNQTAAQMFGVPVRHPMHGATSKIQRGDEVETAKILQKQGYKEVDLPGTEGMLFHPEIATGLEKVNDIMNDRVTMDKWLRGLDQATLVFKGAVTRYNPSFHVRTLASEFMLGYIGGMRNPTWAYPAAMKVLRGRNRNYMGSDPGVAANLANRGLDRELIAAANTLDDSVTPRTLGSAPVGGDGGKVVLRNKKQGWSLSADQLWGLYKSSGLKTGFATTDVQRTMDPMRKSNSLSKVNQKLQNRFEDVEDYGRLAHFMDILKHSKHKNLDEAVAEASQTVLKYHLDYTAVTQFEKSVMTRAMPFYKWVRLSTPMILESMAHNPGKAMVAPKTLASMSEMAGYDTEGFGIAPGGADALTPGFLREAGALPMFNAFGDNQYFNPAQTVPMYGLLNESNQNPFGKVNPLFKIPAELSLNKAVMGPPPRDEGNLQRYILGQTPQTALGNVVAEGAIGEPTPGDVDPRQRLLSFLANPGIQPATKRRVEGEAQMEWDAASKHRRALKKKLGIE